MTLPLFYNNDNEIIKGGFDHLDMQAVISCYKSLSEILELLEIYTSNFNDRDRKQRKKDYNNVMNNFEETLKDVIKYRLSQ